MKPVCVGEIAAGSEKNTAMVPKGLQQCSTQIPAVVLVGKSQCQLGIELYLLGTPCWAAAE